MLGPVLGGLLLGSLGWRWIFLVNVPICIAAIALAQRYLPPDAGTGAGKLDWLGLFLLCPALILLVAGLSGLTVNLAFAGTALLAGFLLHARGKGARGLVDLSLFRTKSFATATLLIFLSGACLYGPMLLMPLFFQRARGLAVEEVGLLLAPQGMGLMATLWFAGRWADHSGPRVVATAGSVSLAAGLAVFVGVGDAPVAVLCCALFAIGGGLGGIGLGTSTAAYRDIEPLAITRAAGLLSVVQRIGASFGTVLAALVLGMTQGSFTLAFAGVLALTLAVCVVVRFLPSSPVERKR